MQGELQVSGQDIGSEQGDQVGGGGLGQVGLLASEFDQETRHDRRDQVDALSLAGLGEGLDPLKEVLRVLGAEDLLSGG